MILNAFDLRFNQPWYVMYVAVCNNVVFFIKVLKSEDFSTELQFFETNYADHVVSDALKAQLAIFKVSMNGCDITCFDNILDKLKELKEPQKSMTNEVVTIFKF